MLDRVDAGDPQRVLAEDRGDAAERRRADQHQLRPAVEERDRPPPALAQVDVHAAGVGQRRGQLGDRQGAAEHDQPADAPTRAASTLASGTRVAMTAGVR